MTHQEFELELEKSIIRSKKLLVKKGIEYSKETANRLDHFYRAGEAQNIQPTEALFSMAMKHVISIADMVKNPHTFTLKGFNEKVTDLRNYTILLDALVRDMKIE